jgi:nucleoside-diphosphate-sugar epimerase
MSDEDDLSAAQSPWGLPIADLDRSVGIVASDIERWNQARILVTGGTGFLGRWILGTTLWSIDRLGLQIDVTVVTRSTKLDALADWPRVSVVQGDLQNWTPPGEYDLVIHGAASSSAPPGHRDGAPTTMASTIIDGTRRVIDSAIRNRARLLFLSSGAVYGKQFAPVSESTDVGPDPLDPSSAYGEAKRAAENYCAVATREGAVDAAIARLFAFVGPGIPLAAHYAIGNFLGDVLAGRTIEVRGDGRPLRSYLYTGDLAEWCWGVISRGVPGRAYNVGSPEAITIGDLAMRVSELVKPRSPIEVRGIPTDGPPPWYVPITERAREELGLEPRTSLGEALNRTFAYAAEN